MLAQLLRRVAEPARDVGLVERLRRRRAGLGRAGLAAGDVAVDLGVVGSGARRPGGGDEEQEHERARHAGASSNSDATSRPLRFTGLASRP